MYEEAPDRLILLQFPGLPGRGQSADECEVYTHFLCYFQYKETWILESPLHKRHAEVRLGGKVRPVNMNLHGNRQLMRSAMKSEGPRDLDRRIAGCCNGALIALGHKRNFSKVRCIQHILRHLLVAASIAALSAS